MLAECKMGLGKLLLITQNWSTVKSSHEPRSVWYCTWWYRVFIGCSRSRIMSDQFLILLASKKWLIRSCDHASIWIEVITPYPELPSATVELWSNGKVWQGDTSWICRKSQFLFDTDPTRQQQEPICSAPTLSTSSNHYLQTRHEAAIKPSPPWAVDVLLHGQVMERISIQRCPSKKASADDIHVPGW